MNKDNLKITSIYTGKELFLDVFEASPSKQDAYYLAITSTGELSLVKKKNNQDALDYQGTLDNDVIKIAEYYEDFSPRFLKTCTLTLIEAGWENFKHLIPHSYYYITAEQIGNEYYCDYELAQIVADILTEDGYPSKAFNETGYSTAKWTADNIPGNEWMDAISKGISQRWDDVKKILKGHYNSHTFYPSFALYNTESSEHNIILEAIKKVLPECEDEILEDSDWHYLLTDEEKTHYADIEDFKNKAIIQNDAIINQAINLIDNWASF